MVNRLILQTLPTEASSVYIECTTFFTLCQTEQGLVNENN